MTVEECINEYETELACQEDPYGMWIKENEGAKLFTKKEYDELFPIVIFYYREGKLSAEANSIYLAFFSENNSCSYAYADEDLLIDGRRKNPWFKPEISIDTIESVNYFGSSFAVKKQVLIKLLDNPIIKKDPKYNFIYEANVSQDTGNVSRISFGKNDFNAYWELIKLLVREEEGGHIDKVLYHGNSEEIITRTIIHNIYDIPEDTFLSIIIPSKDNVDMLKQCILSIKNYARLKYEIIVVDNGSSDENRNVIGQFIDSFENLAYLYKKMDFNFSKMCNLGALNAKGDCLLFLNDDITAFTEGFDKILVSQAIRPETGAVGAKLYYPDSTIIQHVGITNMGIGPAHKLAGIDDHGSDSLYHGRNLADCNVYAVTAAALCVTKEKFADAGCFDAGLSVAYNDVDFCFNLYERGFNNIVRNDVIFYHHESISRGSDESPEKKKRLLKERERLYARHPKSVAYDPFYSKHLVQYRYDGDYNVGYLYPFEIAGMLSKVEYLDRMHDSSNMLIRKIMRKGPICQLNIDSVKEEKDILIVEGWAGLTDEDQCLYERHFILVPENEQKKMYKISVFNKLREDVSAVMTSQKYNKLLGFTCHIDRNDIKAGKYVIGILFTNMTNGKQVCYYKNDEDSKAVFISVFE